MSSHCSKFLKTLIEKDLIEVQCLPRRFIESACHRSLSKVLKGLPQKFSTLSQGVLSSPFKSSKETLKGISQQGKGLQHLLTQLYMTHCNSNDCKDDILQFK